MLYLVLEAIAKYTGTVITALIGCPPQEGDTQFYLKAVHVGETKPSHSNPGKTWSEADSEGFRTAIKQFSLHVVNTDRKSLFISRFAVTHRLFTSHVKAYRPC